MEWVFSMALYTCSPGTSNNHEGSGGFSRGFDSLPSPLQVLQGFLRVTEPSSCPLHPRQRCALKEAVTPPTLR